MKLKNILKEGKKQIWHSGLSAFTPEGKTLQRQRNLASNKPCILKKKRWLPNSFHLFEEKHYGILQCPMKQTHSLEGLLFPSCPTWKSGPETLLWRWCHRTCAGRWISANESLGWHVRTPWTMHVWCYLPLRTWATYRDIWFVIWRNPRKLCLSAKLDMLQKRLSF